MAVAILPSTTLECPHMPGMPAEKHPTQHHHTALPGLLACWIAGLLTHQGSHAVRPALGRVLALHLLQLSARHMLKPQAEDVSVQYVHACGGGGAMRAAERNCSCNCLHSIRATHPSAQPPTLATEGLELPSRARLAGTVLLVSKGAGSAFGALADAGHAGGRDGAGGALLAAVGHSVSVLASGALRQKRLGVGVGAGVGRGHVTLELAARCLAHEDGKMQTQSSHACQILAFFIARCRDQHSQSLKPTSVQVVAPKSAAVAQALHT